MHTHSQIFPTKPPGMPLYSCWTEQHWQWKCVYVTLHWSSLNENIAVTDRSIWVKILLFSHYITLSSQLSSVSKISTCYYTEFLSDFFLKEKKTLQERKEARSKITRLQKHSHELSSLYWEDWLDSNTILLNLTLCSSQHCNTNNAVSLSLLCFSIKKQVSYILAFFIH